MGIIDVITPRALEYPQSAYGEACKGDGPLAFTWTDKPHRIVYDLLAALLQQGREDVDVLNDYWLAMGGTGRLSTVWAGLDTRYLIVEQLLAKIDLGRQMAMADHIMERDRDILAALAKT